MSLGRASAMNEANGRPRMLLVGGAGGLVGRHLLAEFGKDWRIRSLHRHADPSERRTGIEWIYGDATTISDWAPLLHRVEMVVNVAWYRFGPERRFASLAEGLLGLIRAAERAGVPRFVHLSVPDAPPSLETGLPYLVHKRRVDRALESSGLSYVILRPTMLFASRDVLLTVMTRSIARYHLFPMFGDGEFHVSPISARDVARIVRREAGLPGRRIVAAGGPERWRYRDLTDRIFRALGQRPRYVRLSPGNSIRLGRFLETVGSTLLYAYEVEWLLSDMLGLPPYEGLKTPLERVEPFLEAEAARRRVG